VYNKRNSSFPFLNSREIFLATKRDTAFLQTWPVYVYILKPEKCSFRKLRIIGGLFLAFYKQILALKDSYHLSCAK
jgi:hypothetical protein